MTIVGFVGVGTMGRGMVKNLAKNGFDVIAYNRTKDKISDLASDKITIANSIKEVCAGDYVFCCLPNDEALEDVLFGKEGIMPLLNNENTLVDSGTTSVTLTQRVSEECKKSGITFLDAPVTGSKLGAENGTMMFMIGGEKKCFEDARNVFEAMGTRLVYCGPSTYGQRSKIALNMTMSLSLQGYLEGITLALKNDVPLDVIEEIFENSGAKSGIGSFKMPYIKKRDFEQHFMLKLMHKDLKLADAEIKKLGLDLPLAGKISEVFSKSLERGEEDVCTVVKELEKKSGIKIEKD